MERMLVVERGCAGPTGEGRLTVPNFANTGNTVGLMEAAGCQQNISTENSDVKREFILFNL